MTPFLRATSINVLNFSSKRCTVNSFWVEEKNARPFAICVQLKTLTTNFSHQQNLIGVNNQPQTKIPRRTFGIQPARPLHSLEATSGTCCRATCVSLDS